MNCKSVNNKIRDINELINDAVILGRNKFISDYTKMHYITFG